MSTRPPVLPHTALAVSCMGANVWALCGVPSGVIRRTSSFELMRGRGWRRDSTLSQLVIDVHGKPQKAPGRRVCDQLEGSGAVITDQPTVGLIERIRQEARQPAASSDVPPRVDERLQGVDSSAHARPEEEVPDVVASREIAQLRRAPGSHHTADLGNHASLIRVWDDDLAYDAIDTGRPDRERLGTGLDDSMPALGALLQSDEIDIRTDGHASLVLERGQDRTVPRAQVEDPHTPRKAQKARRIEAVARQRSTRAYQHIPRYWPRSCSRSGRCTRSTMTWSSRQRATSSLTTAGVRRPTTSTSDSSITGPGSAHMSDPICGMAWSM